MGLFLGKHDAHFATDSKGAFIVIASHAAPLDPSVGSYRNSAMVERSSATPHLVTDDTDGLRAGGYDGGTYVESNTPGVVADTAYVRAMSGTRQAFTTRWPGRRGAQRLRGLAA